MPRRGDTSSGTLCRQYGYDHFGNRWISASLDTLHMATPTAQSAIDPATNRLTSGTYDAAGNMTAYPFLTDGGSMAYDANNKMTSFSKTGVSVSTKYDAAGRRVRKVYNGETTVWVYDAFGRLAAEYTTEAQATPADVYYRTTDHLGSTRVVTDSTGAVKQRRDFFPFGENIPADSSHGGRNDVLDGGAATYNASLGVRQQFTGQQRDEETGLDYFWARNYQPCLARFSSIDPSNLSASLSAPSLWNAYAYVGNSPVRNSDPDGLKCVDGTDNETGEACFEVTGTASDPSGAPPSPDISAGAGSSYLYDYYLPVYDYSGYQNQVGPPGSSPSFDVQAEINDALSRVASRISASDDCVEGLDSISRNGVTFDQVVNAAASVRIVDGRYAALSVSAAHGDHLWGSRRQAQFDGNLGLPSGEARVWDVFRNPGVGAWTPYRGSAIYISPVAPQHAGRGDAEFEALIFHELMHNITVLGDQEIQSALGIAVQADSTNITRWFRDNCVVGSYNY